MKKSIKVHFEQSIVSIEQGLGSIRIGIGAIEQSIFWIEIGEPKINYEKSHFESGMKNFFVPFHI